VAVESVIAAIDVRASTSCPLMLHAEGLDEQLTER